MATVISYGAAEAVTGSCHLLELANGKRLLIDCGMFQGREEERNNEAFGFDPKTIDYLLVTHAHLNHVGRIPKLVKEGFSGSIVWTKATRDMAEVILLDNAKVMEEDALSFQKKSELKTDENEGSLLLYNEKDVRNVLSIKHYLSRYDDTFALCDGVTVTYRNAGHLLGSAFIEITYIEDEKEKTVVFSGDMGKNNQIVLKNLENCKRANTLFLESTYGDRNHRSTQNSINEFKELVIDTLNNNGTILIPSFAIERTQEILCILKQMYDKDELPECKIFLDSPMSTKITATYRKYAEDLLSNECQNIKKHDGTVFDFQYLNYSRSLDESKAIDDEKERNIIIAGNGMCTGGRILRHLKQRLANTNNTVIFVGYQAEGTLGRKIIDGEKSVSIYNEKVSVEAGIHTINGFSAFIDQSGILNWVKSIKDLQAIFLVHGEKMKQDILKEVLLNTLHQKVHIVKDKEVIHLS